MSRKRKRNQKRREAKTAKSDEGYVMATLGAPLGFQTSTWPSGFKRHLKTYIDAHSLLPHDYVFGTEESIRMVARALEIMADDSADHRVLLWAIVILGHAPCIEALEALEQHGATVKPYAKVARIAASECVDWLACGPDADALAS